MRATVVSAGLQDERRRVPSPRSLRASWPRRRPAAARMRRGEAVGGRAAGDLGQRGHRVQADDEVEVGAAQQVEVRGRADPAVDVAAPGDLDRVVEAGDRARRRDRVARRARAARRRGRRRRACPSRSRPRPPSSSGGRATSPGTKRVDEVADRRGRDEAARQPAGQHGGGRVAARVQQRVQRPAATSRGRSAAARSCRR